MLKSKPPALGSKPMAWIISADESAMKVVITTYNKITGLAEFSSSSIA